jgi:hypothetical protein
VAKPARPPGVLSPQGRTGGDDEQRRRLMALTQDIVEFDVRGDIFQVNGVRLWDPENRRPGSLTFNVGNGAGKWVDVVVESTYPQGSQIWQTGHMDNTSSTSHTEELRFHQNKSVKITRWAPGAFGIPGNGGGEVFFVVPEDGDVTINVDVTG